MIYLRQRHRLKSGIALVVTLAILVLATILVVGFVSSMGTERQAAASIANNTTATIIAQAALDHAVSILDENIPQPRVPSPTPTPPAPIEQPYPEYTKFGGSTVADVSAVNWVTQPGMLTTIARHLSTISDTVKRVPLSTDPDASYASTTEDASVNPPLLAGGANLLTKNDVEMRVAWVPMLRDPTAAGGVANPIIGRYGFWIDDESSKANINTAFGKPGVMNFSQLTPAVISVNSATYPLGHPSSVDLDVLGSLDRTALAAAVRETGGLTSVDAIKRFVTTGSPADYLNANKFDLTAYSRAPEFNVFGRSRLYFLRSMNAPRQLGYPTFQFFRDRDGPNYFPAEENVAISPNPTAADRHATYYTAAAIANYLNRTDWPGIPPESPTAPWSFAKKWDKDASGAPFAGLASLEMGKREADQVAWNLLALGSFAAGDFTGIPTSQIAGKYVELANATSSGEPGFISLNKPNKDAVLGPSSGKAMLPSFPLPLVNEVVLNVVPESYTVAGGIQKYRLHISLTVELWLPPGYPPFDFAQTPVTIGMTYLMFHVTQASPGTANAQQEDAKYVDISAAPNDNGIRKLWMVSDTGSINPGEFQGVTTTLPLYIRNGTGFSDTTTGAQDFTTSGQITVQFRMRLFALTRDNAGSGQKHTFQLIPVWDRHDPATANAPSNWNPAPPSTAPAYLSPPAEDPNDFIEFQFDLDPASFSSGQAITRSLEVADPRDGGVPRKWQPAAPFTDPTQQNVDSFTPTPRINTATTAAGYDVQKLAFVDLTRPAPSSDRPSTGFLSVLPIGMQRGIPGAMPKLQPSGGASTLPDWLLLDLVAPNVVAANYPTMSFMNSTAGRVNMNSEVLPTGGRFTVPARFVPLQALLQNMRANTTVIGNPPAAPSNVVDAITKRRLSPAGGVSYGAPDVYDYDGELAEIEGVSDTGSTDWEKESILRNLATTMTTKSNVFSVWGVAQTVKKNPANNDPARQGIFETKTAGAVADDTVTGEKRFQAIVERYVWPGADASPGNAHVTGPNGNYDRLSSSQSKPGVAPPYSGGTWETLDGPDRPTYPVTNSSGTWTNPGPSFAGSVIETASNPTRALMKYRVIYFKYLTD